ncbi:hypothetical protein ACFLQR_02540 [Verrucomicrobiota bacterium]
MFRKYRLTCILLSVLMGVCVVGQVAADDEGEVFRPSLADIINVTYPADADMTKVFALNQAGSGSAPNYKSHGVEEVTIEGTYTPTHDDECLVVFSDDGAAVYVDGELVHDRLHRGQHFGSLRQSFHLVNAKLTKNKPATIKVIYSNIIFMSEDDVDGLTLFVCKDTGDSVFFIEGELNLNPGKGEDVQFEMQTPSGQIDIETLESGGADYSYSGPATEIKVRPKAKDATLTISGLSVQLSNRTRYTIKSQSMTVVLRNKSKGSEKKKAMGHWWIEIDAADAAIEPNPLSE